MKPLLAAGAVVLFLAAAPLQAQTAPAPAAEPAAQGRGGEPEVREAVIEDAGSRIEELRVRGETQRIVVQSKAGGPKIAGGRYEVIPADGGRDLAIGPTTPRGAIGQRVWRVMQF